MAIPMVLCDLWAPRVTAEKLKGVDARYELSKSSHGVKQAADIRKTWTSRAVDKNGVFYVM